MVHATEVEAVMEAENKKTVRRWGDVGIAGLMQEEMKRLKDDLGKALVDIGNSLAAGSRKR